MCINLIIAVKVRQSISIKRKQLQNGDECALHIYLSDERPWIVPNMESVKKIEGVVSGRRAGRVSKFHHLLK